MPPICEDPQPAWSITRNAIIDNYITWYNTVVLFTNLVWDNVKNLGNSTGGLAIKWQLRDDVQIYLIPSHIDDDEFMSGFQDWFVSDVVYAEGKKPNPDFNFSEYEIGTIPLDNFKDELHFYDNGSYSYWCADIKNKKYINYHYKIKLQWKKYELSYVGKDDNLNKFRITTFLYNKKWDDNREELDSDDDMSKSLDSEYVMNEYKYYWLAWLLFVLLCAEVIVFKKLKNKNCEKISE